MAVGMSNEAAVFANNRSNSGKALKNSGGILPHWVNRQWAKKCIRKERI